MGEQIERRIDRAAIERIIQRAAELQTGERDIGDGLTPAEVMALAKDVGIPETHVRRAILEESIRPSGPTTSSGVLDRVAGPGRVDVSRVVPGDVATVERQLLRWMEQHELLSVQRQQAGRIAWEPKGGLQAALNRGLAGKPYMLGKANRVTATIIALEAGWCQVSLSADLQPLRNSYLGGAGVIGATGGIATGILFTLHAFAAIAIAPIPLVAVAGWAVIRGFQPVVARTQIGLERALDFLEQAKPGALPPNTNGLLGSVLTEVRRALQ